jgi:hypothetical protein
LSFQDKAEPCALTSNQPQFTDPPGATPGGLFKNLKISSLIGVNRAIANCMTQINARRAGAVLRTHDDWRALPKL